MPAFSTRLLANVIDLFIALIILTPLYSIISTIIFGGDNFAALIPNYENIKDNLSSMTELEKEEFYISSINSFYQNNGVLKIFLNQFLQISFLILLTLGCWLYFHTSPGKYILGLKIVDQNTLNPPSNKQFIIRALSVYLSVLTLGISYLLMIFDKKKRTWHDRLSGTMVISPNHHKQT